MIKISSPGYNPNASKQRSIGNIMKEEPSYHNHIYNGENYEPKIKRNMNTNLNTLSNGYDKNSPKTRVQRIVPSEVKEVNYKDITKKIKSLHIKGNLSLNDIDNIIKEIKIITNE